MNEIARLESKETETERQKQRQRDRESTKTQTERQKERAQRKEEKMQTSKVPAGVAAARRRSYRSFTCV